MKTLLIIYPQWPPSNLAGVHRPRLIANVIEQFGWKPIVLTVDSRYYEEAPDLDLNLTVRKDIEVIYTKAHRVMKPRLIGDIGLRSFSFLYHRALKLIIERGIEFIWIPMPSFYTALLGPKLFGMTGVPYGIDYIDPWVRDITTRKDWRHRLSNMLARYLEPKVVKKAALITGVSAEYYLPTIRRNFDGKVDAVMHAAFPYGFDPNDHKIKIKDLDYPWSAEENIIPWIYAGAFLPNSRLIVELLFKVIGEIRKSGMWDEGIRLYFLGTGAYLGKSIQDYAEQADIEDIVVEDRNRHAFLHVLNYLSEASTVMVLGSTEKHYTASKMYQAILSGTPVFALMHAESSAVAVLEECGADQYLVRYQDGMGSEDLKNEMKRILQARLKNDTWSPDLKALDKYSARESARKLVEAIEQVIGKK